MSAAVIGFWLTVGFHPWHPQDNQMMLLVMDNKTWLVEMEVAVCFVAIAFVALTLMTGHSLWKSMAGR